jgi:hypothetical protein
MNPARCLFTTVLGVTKTRGLVHPHQNILNATQNSLCRAVNRRRGRCAYRASNWRRRAQVFEDEVLAGAQSADHPSEKILERRDHSQNRIGKVRIELCAKSFILQVYDVLARHNQQVYLEDDYVEKQQGRILPGEEEVLVKILDEHDVAIFLIDLGIEKPAAVRRHG